MRRFALILTVSLALALSSGAGTGAMAQEGAQTRLDQLFAALQHATAAEAPAIEDEIWSVWSHSGSPTLDLLLERGLAALEAGETATAIEHLTALTDHAPDFAEGWNALATAYYAAGLIGPALADIERALALEPRHFGAMAGLGIILEETGQPARALEVYHQVLAIHPHRADVRDAAQRLEEAARGTAL